LELIRDGIEDYEYFHLLERLTEEREPPSPEAVARVSGSRRLLALDDDLVRSYRDYSPRPDSYRSYRRQLARAIMATQQ
jgi:hypothetical protein